MGAKQVQCFVTLQGWQQGFKCRGGAVERNSTTTNGFAPLPTSRTQTLYVVWSEDIISSFCMYFISLSRRFLNILFIETYSFLFNYRYQLVFPYNWRETIRTWLWITTEDYSILKSLFSRLKVLTHLAIRFYYYTLLLHAFFLCYKIVKCLDFCSGSYLCVGDCGTWGGCCHTTCSGEAVRHF